MKVDPEKKLHSAELCLRKKRYNEAMEFYTKATFYLLYCSKNDTCTKTAMEKTIHCYSEMNPTFSTDPNFDYIQKYFAVVRHWLDHRKLSSDEIKKELSREIPFPSADDSREELPSGETSSRLVNSHAFSAATASGQGIRDEMEDACLAITFTIGNISPLKAELFCVFDGHGGKTCAQFAAEELPKRLKKRLEQIEKYSEANIYEAITETCVSIDESWKELPLQIEGWKDISGSTAVIALYLDQKELWLANVGDSGAVIELNGQKVQLSEPAKPTNPRYCQEIYLRGGIVTYGRVDATLDMARSIGDLSHPSVSARPTIKKIEVSDSDHTLIIACDGLWDVIDGQAALDWVREKSPKEAAELLRTLAYQRGSSDNVSIIVVKPKKFDE